MLQVTRLLLPEVVLLADVSYRKIPGYVSAYAGENGEIVLIKSDGSIKKPVQFEWKTTKGTYKYIKLVNDNFVQVTKAIHQLVCLAYHGNPPSDGYIHEPNHIDCDKHNNKPSNLEWMNRSRNIQHAYDSGICQQGLRIELINVIDKTTKKFHSLSSLSRYLNITRSRLRDLMSKHRDIPYDNKYLFMVDDSSDKKIERATARGIMYKDYEDGNIYIVTSSADASVRTGVKAGIISLRTREVTSLETQNKLLSKYVFKPIKNNHEWPIYTIEEALKSKHYYETKDL